jgi:hypothetical protein
MYSINGVPLDHPDMGWVFRAASKPLSGLSLDRTTLQAAGRDGIISLPGATLNAVGLSLVVQTPRSNHESLVALFAEDGLLSLTDAPTRVARYEFLASSPVGAGPAEQLLDVTFTIRLVDSTWRAAVETTTPALLTAASVPLVLFPGLSAPVQDAVVKVKGAAAGLLVTDTSGAWLSFPNVPAGQWLRVEGRRAFLTSTDTWTGGVDVSGDLRQGGPRRRFEITPQRGATPDLREGRLTITTSSRTAAAIEVRGRSAHLQAER